MLSPPPASLQWFGAASSGSAFRSEPSIREARELLKKLVSVDTITGAELSDVLRGKGQLIMSIDRSFCIEHCLIDELPGRAGEQVMETILTRCMPSPGRLVKVLDAKLAVQQLQQGPIGRFTGQAAGETLQSVLEVLESLIRGQSPSTKWMTSAFMQKVQQVMGGFCTRHRAGRGKVAINVIGKEAAKDRLQHVTAMGDSLGLADLDQILAFFWLPKRRRPSKDSLRRRSQRSLRVLLPDRARRQGPPRSPRHHPPRTTPRSRRRRLSTPTS